MAFKKKRNGVVKIAKEVANQSYQKTVDKDWSDESDAFFAPVKKETSSSSGGDSIFKSEALNEPDEPEQLNIESEIKNLELNQETLEKNDSLNQRVDIFFEKVKDFIELKQSIYNTVETNPFVKTQENNILDDINKTKNKVAGSFFDTKELLIDIKKYLRDIILEDGNNITTKELILELGKLLNEFFDETAKTTTSMTVITSLVPYEEPKEESKKEEVKEEFFKQKPKQLSLWTEVFCNTTLIGQTTIQNYEDEDITFKVTIESPKYADPFIEIKGKVFVDDIRNINEFLDKFKKLALKE